MTTANRPPADGLSDAIRALNESIVRMSAILDARQALGSRLIRQRGQSWRYVPGPPIDEAAWLRWGVVATIHPEKETP
jgi:hypothetical protein